MIFHVSHLYSNTGFTLERNIYKLTLVANLRDCPTAQSCAKVDLALAILDAMSFSVPPVLFNESVIPTLKMVYD